MKRILLTGGAGFIGSHLVRLLVNKYPNYHIYNLDALTYAGNLENLRDVEQAPNYTFCKADITDADAIRSLLETYEIDTILNLAAESHVDRSILDPLAFVKTNVLGTVTLLNEARQYWQGRTDVLFYHISTDEVYGSLGAEGFFTETTPYDPRSPYSASKASSDHFVRAYGHTYGLPVRLSNCSNNYGPYQFPEKLIPLMIHHIREGKPLPVYGKGENIRDWLWVGDHCEAIDLILHQGKNLETYNIGGHNEWKNLDLVHLLCDQMDEKLGKPAGTGRQLIRFVTDRPGHDLRYAIDAGKIAQELGWTPKIQFPEGLSRTIDWYLENEAWVKHIVEGTYRQYYARQYASRS
ncbi:MAG: dTDP-glucose 4,6-dehydratase [Bacteroidetes bacterium]|jgi:dTDP-glucose 4,6-dehydratase|nr:dTDP-glucose 4,6-dehydratase [Bacteroidota bacterium]